jgi:hypothetical protein
LTILPFGLDEDLEEEIAAEKATQLEPVQGTRMMSRLPLLLASWS